MDENKYVIEVSHVNKNFKDNKVLKDVITKLLETTTNFIYDKKYAIYLKEYNFSIIFKIDLEMLEFNLYTILPGRGVAKVQDIFVL